MSARRWLVQSQPNPPGLRSACHGQIAFRHAVINPASCPLALDPFSLCQKTARLRFFEPEARGTSAGGEARLGEREPPDRFGLTITELGLHPRMGARRERLGHGDCTGLAMASRVLQGRVDGETWVWGPGPRVLTRFARLTPGSFLSSLRLRGSGGFQPCGDAKANRSQWA